MKLDLKSDILERLYFLIVGGLVVTWYYDCHYKHYLTYIFTTAFLIISAFMINRTVKNKKNNLGDGNNEIW